VEQRTLLMMSRPPRMGRLTCLIASLAPALGGGLVRLTLVPLHAQQVEVKPPPIRDVRDIRDATDGTNVTFAKNVAPVVFERCVICHHDGGPAPFSLASYAAVRQHAKQIAAVTKSRFM